MFNRMNEEDIREATDPNLNVASMLGFNEADQALMIALYISMDNFGTACNVTGDGAIALVVNKIRKK